MRLQQFVLGSCACLMFTAAAAHAADEVGLTGVVWLAEDIGGGGVVDNVRSTLQIDASGKVSGSGGCNRLMSSAKVVGEKITFAPPATTRMMCPPAILDQEQKFLQALQKARAYKIEDPFLRLLGEDGVELVRLIKSDP